MMSTPYFPTFLALNSSYRPAFTKQHGHFYSSMPSSPTPAQYSAQTQNHPQQHPPAAPPNTSSTIPNKPLPNNDDEPLSKSTTTEKLITATTLIFLTVIVTITALLLSNPDPDNPQILGSTATETSGLPPTIQALQAQIISLQETSHIQQKKIDEVYAAYRQGTERARRRHVEAERMRRENKRLRDGEGGRMVMGKRLLEE